MSNKKKVQKEQKTISYRDGDFTSKITVQPAIYEALNILFNGKAYSWLAEKAVEARIMKQTRISGYVREIALINLFPRNIMKDYKLDTSVDNISYRIFNEKGERVSVSTVTMPRALMYYLDEVTNGNGRFVVEKMANEIRRHKLDETRDISFDIKESLIYQVFSDHYIANS